MKWGSVVWFPDHQRPFLVEEEYCTNPDCACEEVTVSLREIGDEGDRLPQPLSFWFRVDLTTWRECDPPSRSARVSRWVRQFLSTWPPERRLKVREQYDWHKQFARRKAEYTIDPDTVLRGELFSYGDLLDEKGALSSGGLGFTYRVFLDDREYLVEDVYCPNPECDCHNVQLRFWEWESRPMHDAPGDEEAQDDDAAPQAVSFRELFLGSVNFSGRRKVATRVKTSLAEAEAVLAAWWDDHHNSLSMLKNRYRQVKEIGRRSLDKAHVRAVVPNKAAMQQPAAPPPHWLTGPREGEPLTQRRRVGRNEPCPCGSGKKFKKCCG